MIYGTYFGKRGKRSGSPLTYPRPTASVPSACARGSVTTSSCTSLLAHGAALREVLGARCWPTGSRRIIAALASTGAAPSSWTSGAVPDLDRAPRPDNGRVARGQSLGVSVRCRGES